MTDATPGTPTGQPSGSDVDVQAQVEAPGTSQDVTPGSEAQVDDVEKRIATAAAAARRDEAKKAKAEKDRADALEAELQKYREQEQARKDAELSEIERAQQAAAANERQAKELEAQLAAERLGRLRADMIAADPNAALLPLAYKNLITGDSPEALQESLTAALAEYQKDREGILASAAPKPASLGTATAAPGQPASAPSGTEWSPENNTAETWRLERERRFGLKPLR